MFTKPSAVVFGNIFSSVFLWLKSRKILIRGIPDANPIILPLCFPVQVINCRRIPTFVQQRARFVVFGGDGLADITDRSEPQNVWEEISYPLALVSLVMGTIKEKMPWDALFSISFKHFVSNGTS